MARRLPALLFVLLAACGEDEAPAPPAPPPTAALPVVEPVAIEDRAAHALRCLTRGPPRGSGLLGTLNVNTWNLDLAMRDLRAMAPQALGLLDDEELLQRTVRGANASADPWINILRLLQNIPQCPESLALRWAAPALRTVERRDLAPLRLEAIRILSVLQGPEAANLLYRFFEAEPHQRDVAAFALKGLFEAGEPWRTQAVDLVLRRSGPTIWEQVHNRLAALVPPGSRDAAVADLETWWSVLADGSGPRLPAKLPQTKTAPWGPARLWLHPGIPRAGGPDASLQPAYGPLASTLSRGAGWYAADLTKEALFPSFGYTLTGKLPAADARCVLARWGYPAYRASVQHDLTTEVGAPRDDGLYFVALHCMLDPDAEESGGAVKRKLRALLDRPEPASMANSQEIQRLIQALPPAEDDPESLRLLGRVIREVRPLDLYRLPLELAYDALAAHPEEQRALLESLIDARVADRASLGVALSLMQRARSAAHLPLLEALLADSEDARTRRVLRRMLIYIYAAGDAEPKALEAFVQRLRGWLHEADDATLAATAGALLDFGRPGAEAYREGLLGPRRTAFLRGWPQDGRVMPMSIASAVTEPVTAATPDREARAILHLAYRAFPAEAAPYVVLLRRNVRSDLAKAVDAVLERVTHRAPGLGR